MIRNHSLSDQQHALMEEVCKPHITWSMLHQGGVLVSGIEPGTEIEARDPLISNSLVLLVVDDSNIVRVRSAAGRVEPAAPSHPSVEAADTSISEEMPMSTDTKTREVEILGKVEARFYVASIDLKPNDVANLTASAVCRGPENRQWAQATPIGKIEMTLSGGGAEAWFTAMRGREMKVTFEARDPLCDECHNEVPNIPGKTGGYVDNMSTFLCPDCQAKR